MGPRPLAPVRRGFPQQPVVLARVRRSCALLPRSPPSTCPGERVGPRHPGRGGVGVQRPEVRLPLPARPSGSAENFRHPSPSPATTAGTPRRTSIGDFPKRSSAKSALDGPRPRECDSMAVVVPLDQHVGVGMVAGFRVALHPRPLAISGLRGVFVREEPVFPRLVPHTKP